MAMPLLSGPLTVEKPTHIKGTASRFQVMKKPDTACGLVCVLLMHRLMTTMPMTLLKRRLTSEL